MHCGVWGLVRLFCERSSTMSVLFSLESPVLQGRSCEYCRPDETKKSHSRFGNWKIHSGSLGDGLVDVALRDKGELPEILM